MTGSDGKGWTVSDKKRNENSKSGNKYKWDGKWKYLGGDKEKYWILNSKEECYGLIVEWQRGRMVVVAINEEWLRERKKGKNAL